MCHNIQYIKNVTILATFNNAAGQFSKQLTGMPDAKPDEVIIRALNFNGEAADTFMYVITCNLTNDIIGSFCGGSLAPHFPQTKIILNNAVPNSLQFTLSHIVSGGGISPISSMSGDLAIHMDFIWYKKA
jgi:hypothetical protein